jgi:hypothetical protein
MPRLGEFARHGLSFTSLVGKYLNGCALGAGDGYVPPGWDDWHGT